MVYSRVSGNWRIDLLTVLMQSVVGVVPCVMCRVLNFSSAPFLVISTCFCWLVFRYAAVLAFGEARDCTLDLYLLKYLNTCTCILLYIGEERHFAIS